jgi:predicted kinase
MDYTKTVIIMRGLPGSGKSTAIKSVKVDKVICSADNFFMVDGEYRFDPSKLPQAHQACLRDFMSSINAQASTIIVDNTNIRLWEYSTYSALAEAYGYKVILIEMANKDVPLCAERNTHGVPRDAIQRMKDAWEAPLGWHENIIL